MSTIWYTSDLHIGHRLVAEIRGFTRTSAEGLDEADPFAHDVWLAYEWDRTVKPGDQVFVLGDISINGKQHALDWIKARPGTKHLISGNHDPVHPAHRTAAKLLPYWGQYFETVQPFLRRKLNGHDFLLSHFPYASYGDGPGRKPETRFEQYRLPELGLPLLHGHTHGPERDHDNMLHVGWDAWRSLVPQELVLEWLNTVS